MTFQENLKINWQVIPDQRGRYYLVGILDPKSKIYSGLDDYLN